MSELAGTLLHIALLPGSSARTCTSCASDIIEHLQAHVCSAVTVFSGAVDAPPSAKNPPSVCLIPTLAARTPATYCWLPQHSMNTPPIACSTLKRSLRWLVLDRATTSGYPPPRNLAWCLEQRARCSWRHSGLHPQPSSARLAWWFLLAGIRAPHTHFASRDTVRRLDSVVTHQARMTSSVLPQACTVEAFMTETIS